MAALSPAIPIRMLSQEALLNAIGLCDLVIALTDMSVDGREAQMLATLPQVGAVALKMRPFFESVIATQQQAAEAVNLTQRTLAPFFGPKTAEHPNPANDDQSLSPQQPGPDVA